MIFECTMEYVTVLTYKLDYLKKVKVSRDRPRWLKGFRVG